MKIRSILLLSLFCVRFEVFSQNRIGTGKVHELYEQLCASCHGAELEGGLGNSLLDQSTWNEVGKTTNFLDYVKAGNLDKGMPGFGEALSDPQIRSLEIYIDEVAQQKEREGIAEELPVDGLYQAAGYNFKVETVVEDLELPWSIAFMPDGGKLITERAGQLRYSKDGTLSTIEGTPEVWQHGQGGLLEVALHPDFDQNGWIYLAFSHSGGKEKKKKVGMTKVVRGRVSRGQWIDEETIFEVPLEMQIPTGAHFGTRLVFQDGYLFFGIGDRGRQPMVQDLSRPNGKIHRIHDDGRIPEDNPFADEAGSYPTVWTYGNRNPQGLDAHPVTGMIWESEHGPRGGDEINLIEPGKNYGWPVITYGMNYSGTPITEKTEAPGMEQPKLYWTPSIAVCGIDFYEGDAFPEWKNNLFVGGLASEELHRLVIEEDRVVSDEIVLRGLGRVRDVASGPDGFLYLVLNGPDGVVRLRPVE